MLYLHCGWGKTGTTTLQGVLAEHGERLAERGVTYAQEWATLPQALAGPQVDTAIEGFRDFLGAQGERDVIYSNEWLTSLLWGERRQEALLALLAAAEQAMPVTCIWTLRRLDEVILSLHRAPHGKRVGTSPAKGRARDLPWIVQTFRGACRLDRADRARSAYVEYAADGSHNGRLLRAFGLPDDLVVELERRLGEARRLNVALSQKQAAALANAEALATRLEVPADKEALRRLFDTGFAFDDDRPYVPAGPGGDFHREVLELASEEEFDPYLRFFEKAQTAPAAPTPLVLDVLRDDDLARLTERLSGGR